MNEHAKPRLRRPDPKRDITILPRNTSVPTNGVSDAMRDTWEPRRSIKSRPSGGR